MYKSDKAYKSGRGSGLVIRRGRINLVEILKEFWVSLRNSWKSPRQDPENELAQLRLYIAFGVLTVG